MRETADFDAFYASTSRRVVGHLYVMVGDRAEAEDSAQEAYARAWQRWQRVRDYVDPESWVRTVAYRIAVSSWRKSFNRIRAQERHGPGADLPDLNPDQVALTAALRLLRPDQRRVLVLHHVVGLSVAEISAEIGVPAGTVKTWLARGRQALARHLSDPADPAQVAGSGEPGGRPHV